MTKGIVVLPKNNKPLILHGNGNIFNVLAELCEKLGFQTKPLVMEEFLAASYWENRAQFGDEMAYQKDRRREVQDKIKDNESIFLEGLAELITSENYWRAIMPVAFIGDKGKGIIMCIPGREGKIAHLKKGKYLDEGKKVFVKGIWQGKKRYVVLCLFDTAVSKMRFFESNVWGPCLEL